MLSSLISHTAFMTPVELVLGWRLFAALMLGAVLGLERSIAGKHAGMRTYALVSLGSALFTVIGIVTSYQFSIFSGLNPTQIVGSVVIGVGFIGAGLISFRKDGSSVELTTTAGIWVVAGIGMASGFGLFWLALITTVLAFITFALLDRVEYALQARFGKDNVRD